MTGVQTCALPISKGKGGFLGFGNREKKIKKELESLGLGKLLETDPKKGRNPEGLKELVTESIMFGLLLFSIVLMISNPQITGFTVLSLPVYVNLPLVLGVALFIIDLIIIEKWFRKK